MYLSTPYLQPESVHIKPDRRIPVQVQGPQAWTGWTVVQEQKLLP